MQLNTLNSISKRTVLNHPALPKMAHRILLLHHHLFIVGGSLFQNLFEPIIHTLNTQTNHIQTLQVSKLPHLQGFALFQYGEYIYLWGGATPNPQISNSSSMSNCLLQFDGSRVVSIHQSGQIPSPRCFFAYTLYSNRYLIVCGGFDCDQFYNSWHIMDLKYFSWKKIKVSSQMPFSYRSTMKWSNGRGYILLQQTYFQQKDEFHQNLFYQFKFQNFKRLQIKLIPVKFNAQIIDLKVQFSNMCFLQNNLLILFGGQKNFMKKDFSYHKYGVLYNYQTLQWQLFNIDFQGTQFQALYRNGKLFIVGGVKAETQMFPIQIIALKQILISNETSHLKNFLQNGLCYNCETIYGYKQIQSNFIVKNQFQPFNIKSKIQNKFLWKFSQIFRSPFQAIGCILDWFINMKFYQIQIRLKDSYAQTINPDFTKRIYPAEDNENMKFLNFLHFQGYSQSQDVLSYETIRNCLIKGEQDHICRIQRGFYYNASIQSQGLQLQCKQNSINKKQNSRCFFALMLGAFRLGYSFLYVTFTKQSFITVFYVSCLQTESPQMVHQKNSVISYNISLCKSSNTFQYSSQINRHIIFQNLRPYFQKRQAYEQQLTYFNPQKSKNANFLNLSGNKIRSSLYIFGCSQLEKNQVYSFNNMNPNLKKNSHQQKNIQSQHNSYDSHFFKYCDIALKSVSKKNTQNSLLKYLEALFINLNIQLKISVQKTVAFRSQSREGFQSNCNSLQQFFRKAEQQQKIKQVKLAHPREKSAKIKNQHEETHFTTMQDQNQIPIQKLQIFKSWNLYEIISEGQQYKGIFFYIEQRLMFVHRNTAFPYIVGIIELNEKDKRTQLLLNKGQFASLQTESTVKKWVQSLQTIILQRRINEQKI